MSDVGSALIGFAGTVLTGGLARFVWNAVKRVHHVVAQSPEQKQFDVSMLALTKVREAQTQQNALLQQDVEALRQTLREEREAHRTDRESWAEEREQWRQEAEQFERRLRGMAEELAMLRARHAVDGQA